MRHIWVFAALGLAALGAGYALYQPEGRLEARKGVAVDNPKEPDIAGRVLDEAEGGQVELSGPGQSVATARAGVGSVRSEHAADAALPHSATERSLLSEGMVNEKAINALNSPRFDGFVTEFEKEQQGVSAELTAAYRAEITRSLEQVSEPKQIDRFVCGVSVCIVSIRSPSNSWYPAWVESIQGASALPMNTWTTRSFDLGGGNIEYRLLFSTAKNVTGFSGSPLRR